MTDISQFVLIIIGAVGITRIFLLPRTRHSTKIFGYETHHYMQGIILILLGLAISNWVVGAIGIGLFIDQLPQIVTNRWRDYNEYYSWKSYVGIFIAIVFIFLFKENIFSIF